MTKEDVSAIAAKPSGFHPGPPGLKSDSKSTEAKSEAKEPQAAEAKDSGDKKDAKSEEAADKAPAKSEDAKEP